MNDIKGAYPDEEKYFLLGIQRHLEASLRMIKKLREERGI